MARIQVTTLPGTVVAASSIRDVLELVNYSDTTIHIRHGGPVDLASEANCGIPLPAGASRAVTGAMAKLSLSAQLETGAAAVMLHFAEY